MKTLAQLKRDLVIGARITLIEAPNMPTHKFLGLTRWVCKIGGTGIYLSLEKDWLAGKSQGSFMDIPRAALVDYSDDGTISIYENGERPLTDEEKRIIAASPYQDPKNKEQMQIDMMGDGSCMFYRQIRYMKEAGFEYLLGHKRIAGKYLTRSADNKTEVINDENIRGPLILKYRLEKSAQ